MEMNMQELFASLRIELMEDPRQTAAILADFAKAWAEMLEKVGLEVEASLTINEGRAKRPPGRPRKPRLVAPPPDEAA
jgi:hypothetical protein